MTVGSPLIAHVQETGESAYAVSISVSGHTIKGDEPVASGGGNLGPAPYDLLLAALGECTSMTVRWYALAQKWPLTKVEVKLSHRKINASDLPEGAGKSGKIDLFEKQVILHGDALTEQQRSKLVDIAAKCPIQLTLQSDLVIRSAA